MKLYIFQSNEDPAKCPTVVVDEMKAHEVMAEFVGQSNSDFRVNRNWEDLQAYYQAFCNHCDESEVEYYNFNFWVTEI